MAEVVSKLSNDSQHIEEVKQNSVTETKKALIKQSSPTKRQPSPPKKKSESPRKSEELINFQIKQKFLWNILS